MKNYQTQDFIKNIAVGCLVFFSGVGTLAAEEASCSGTDGELYTLSYQLEMIEFDRTVASFEGSDNQAVTVIPHGYESYTLEEGEYEVVQDLFLETTEFIDLKNSIALTCDVFFLENQGEVEEEETNEIGENYSEITAIEQNNMFPVATVKVYYNQPCNARFARLEQDFDADTRVLKVAVVVEVISEFCYMHLPPYTEEVYTFKLGTMDGPIEVVADTVAQQL